MYQEHAFIDRYAAAAADMAALHATYVDNLAWAAQQAAAHGLAVLIEPLNARDAPGHFLSTQAQANAVVADIVGVQTNHRTLGRTLLPTIADPGP